MTDLENAKRLLDTGEYTCVICGGGNIFTSSERGVKPLLAWYEQNADFSGLCAADKVVGKATAFLYVLLGVRSVYARVLSRSALEILQKNQIEVSFLTLADNIINRRGDGICPFEGAVLGIEDKHCAYQAICQKMKEFS